MAMRIRRARLMQRGLCVFLAATMASGPCLSVVAQTNAAAMAVRQRVEGIDRGPGPAGPESPPNVPGPPGSSQQPSPYSQAPGKIDTRYISQNAAVVIVLRPAQLLAAPVAQLFPVEIATAAGQKYLGFDPAEMEEVIAFVEPFNPTAPPAYGVTIKFKNPIRASSIPPERRAHAQLADLNGKKYLKSASPMLYSLYGPNNKTLVLATDATLQQLVQSAAQPKSGPMIDRIREVPTGSDLYASVDLTSFRPFIQMGLAQAQAQAPPDAKQYMEVPNLVSGLEATVNLSSPGPTSFVVHCNDEAAAQKVESLIQEALQKYKAADQAQQPGGDEAIDQAMARYKDRMSQPFQPQRNGTSITCFRIDGQNPAQQQLVSVGLVGLGVAALLPAVQAARNAARQAQPNASAGGPGPGEQPAPTEPQAP